MPRHVPTPARHTASYAFAAQQQGPSTATALGSNCRGPYMTSLISYDVRYAPFTATCMADVGMDRIRDVYGSAAMEDEDEDENETGASETKGVFGGFGGSVAHVVSCRDWSLLCDFPLLQSASAPHGNCAKHGMVVPREEGLGAGRVVLE